MDIYGVPQHNAFQWTQALVSGLVLLILTYLPFIVLAIGLVLIVNMRIRKQRSKVVIATLVVGVISSVLFLPYTYFMNYMYSLIPISTLFSVLSVVPFVVLAVGLSLFIRDRANKKKSSSLVATILAVGITSSVIPVIVYLMLSSSS